VIAYITKMLVGLRVSEEVEMGVSTSPNTAKRAITAKIKFA